MHSKKAKMWSHRKDVTAQKVPERREIKVKKHSIYLEEHSRALTAANKTIGLRGLTLEVTLIKSYAGASPQPDVQRRPSSPVPQMMTPQPDEHVPLTLPFLVLTRLSNPNDS